MGLNADTSKASVNHFSVALKILAPVFFVVGALHLVMGLGADQLLGAELPAAVLADPSLDSQNRFYGTAFTLYGAVFYLSAQDLDRYHPILKCALWIFLAAGLARLVSIAVYGLPSTWVLTLLASELILPPVFIYWLGKK